jgi:hypothetical protein
LTIDVAAASFDATARFWAGALSAVPEPMDDMPEAYVHLAEASSVL